jgi:hypothetical protein
MDPVLCWFAAPKIADYRSIMFEWQVGVEWSIHLLRIPAARVDRGSHDGRSLAIANPRKC